MPDSRQRYRVLERLESGGLAEGFRAESEGGATLEAIMDHIEKSGYDLPVQAAVFVAHELCEGLAYAHALVDSSGEPSHIIHRDVSPANVFITKDGEVGLATASSQIEKSDARTDIFAVGIILWELLAGRRLLGEAVQVPPISQMAPQVPEALELILARALARDPAQRYQTARALGQDLSKLMLKQGAAVSALTIAELAQDAMQQRERPRPPEPGINDRPTQEAPARASGFVNVGSWVDEIEMAEKPASSIREGKLAALEEGPDEEHGPTSLDAVRRAFGPARASPAAGRLRPAPRPTPASSDRASDGIERRTRSAIALKVAVALVVLVMVMAAAAAAWFTYRIPHR